MASIRRLPSGRWQAQVRRIGQPDISRSHHLFEIARDEWGIPLKENPLDKLKLQAPDQRRERRLKPGELDRLMQEARKCRGLSRLVAPIILFAVETGMRRGEILNVRHEHINTATRETALSKLNA